MTLESQGSEQSIAAIESHRGPFAVSPSLGPLDRDDVIALQFEQRRITLDTWSQSIRPVSYAPNKGIEQTARR